MKEDIFCFILMCSGLPFFILDVIGTTEKGIKQIKIGGGLIGVSQAVEFLLKISNVSFKLADLSGWAIVIIGSIILIRAVVFQSQKHGSKNNENEFWNRPGLATLTEQQKREHIQKFTKQKRFHLLTFFIWIGICLSAIILVDYHTGLLLNISPTIWMPGFILFIGVIIILSLKNWRCPACKKNMRMGFNPKVCPNCGIHLESGKGVSPSDTNCG